METSDNEKIKIKNVDKSTKKIDRKQICAIAKAGLGVAVTYLLISSGRLDYDQMMNWESYDNITKSLSVISTPMLDMKATFDFVKTAVTTIGLNTLFMATKSLTLAKSIIDPIIQNNPKFEKVKMKIKKVLKGNKRAEKSAEESAKRSAAKAEMPKALINLARNGLGLGLKIFMITSGQIDYNSVYDFSELPHKFAKIGEIAQNIDLNKINLGIGSLGSIFQFFKERREEKEKGMPLIKPISFKEVFKNISKNKVLPRFEQVNAVDLSMNEKPKERYTDIIKEGI